MVDAKHRNKFFLENVLAKNFFAPEHQSRKHRRNNKKFSPKSMLRNSTKAFSHFGKGYVVLNGFLSNVIEAM